MKLLRVVILRPWRRDLLRTAWTILAMMARDLIATHSAVAAAIADVRVSLRNGRSQSMEAR
jgi:hypothetical protein